MDDLVTETSLIIDQGFQNMLTGWLITGRQLHLTKTNCDEKTYQNLLKKHRLSEPYGLLLRQLSERFQRRVNETGDYRKSFEEILNDKAAINLLQEHSLANLEKLMEK